MKYLSWLLLTALVAPAAQFEGKIQFRRAEPPAPAHDVFYWVKGDRNRVEVWRERANAFLTDLTKKETTVILEDARSYLVLPAQEPLFDGPRLEKTGQKGKLLGYAVEKYLFVSDEGTTELWLAEGLGRYTGFGEGYAPPRVNIPNVDVPEPPPPHPWEFALFGTSLFPLRVITRDGMGRDTFILEARAITPGPVNDRLFLPSPTYKEVKDWPKPE